MNGKELSIYLVVYILRKEIFSVSYCLYSMKLSDEENWWIFGKCNNKNGYGYNYIVKVIVCGLVDFLIGMVMNLMDLKMYMGSVLEFLDYKNFDLDVLYFSDVCLIVENIVVYIWKCLLKCLFEGILFEVKIDEIGKNFVCYRGGMSVNFLFDVL